MTENNIQSAEVDYVVMGVNHKSAAVDVREKLSVSTEQIGPTLLELTKQPEILESFLVSTCNRLEIYVVSKNVEQVKTTLQHWFDQKGGEGLKEDSRYYYRGAEAIAQLFKVTASLDSMLVGETQITGQIKDAFEIALAHDVTGIYMNRAVQQALSIAKKVRTDTALGEKTVSFGSTTVELAKKIFDHLPEHQVVIVGAGEMAELVLTHLIEAGVYKISVVNRTLDKAKALLPKGIGEVFTLDHLEQTLQKADIVISSVGGSDFILTYAQVEKIIKHRNGRPLLCVDLGVPRNIEPRIQDLSDVYLYNIDDLKQIIESNLAFRAEEAVKGEKLVQKEAVQFFKSVLGEAPTLAILAKKMDSLRKTELKKTLERLPHLSPEDQKAIEKCTESIVSKILYDPMMSLKSAPSHGEKQLWHEVLSHLFKLKND